MTVSDGIRPASLARWRLTRAAFRSRRSLRGNFDRGTTMMTRTRGARPWCDG